MSAGDNDETGLDRVREACRRAGNDWTGAEAVAGIERYNQAIREELRTAGDALADATNALLDQWRWLNERSRPDGASTCETRLVEWRSVRETPRRGGWRLVFPHVATTDAEQTINGSDAADLYAGDRYLGTLPDLGALVDLIDEFEPADPEAPYGEADYVQVVERLLARRGTTEWPHSYPDSTSTPFAWRWAGNAVQVYRLGALYATVYPTWARPRPGRRSPFPTMLDAE